MFVLNQIVIAMFLGWSANYNGCADCLGILGKMEKMSIGTMGKIGKIGKHSRLVVKISTIAKFCPNPQNR